MQGRDDLVCKFAFGNDPSLPHEGKVRANERLGGGGSQTNQGLRLYFKNLRKDPGSAGVDFISMGRLMKTAFAFPLPLEVLHCVGHIHGLSIDADACESFV